MRRKITISIVFVIIVAAASFIWLRSFMTSLGPDSGNVVVQIERGQSGRTTSDELHRMGVIGDADYFYWNMRLDGNSALIKSGEYEFKTPLTPKNVILKLARGDEKKYDLTIPEGFNVREIQQLIVDSEICSPNHLSRLLSDEAILQKYGYGGSLEGYLFPSTYHLAKSACGEKLIKTFRRTLDEKLAGIPAEPHKLHKILTLASIVEKETAVPAERQRIAGVYANRLKRGMKLQADPTVIYGIKDFKGNIRYRHLRDPHPYNTYVHKGLPPGPIGNPGLKSIEAALNPEEHEYLYFVAKDDGAHEFCKTYRCHRAAVKKWQLGK